MREGASAPQLQVTACMPMRRFPCSSSSSSIGGGSSGGGGAKQQEGPVLTLYCSLMVTLHTLLTKNSTPDGFLEAVMIRKFHYFSQEYFIVLCNYMLPINYCSVLFMHYFYSVVSLYSFLNFTLSFNTCLMPFWLCLLHDQNRL